MTYDPHLHNTVPPSPYQDLSKLIGNRSLSVKEWLELMAYKANDQYDLLRRQHVGELIDLFNGEQEDYVISELYKIFTLQEYEELGLQIEYTNIIAMIIEEISKIYKFGVRRDLIRQDKTEPDEIENELWEWIQKNSKITRVMQSVNEFTNLCGTCCIRPRINSKGIPCFDIVTPDLIWAISNYEDPTNADAIIYAQEAIYSFVDLKENEKVVYYYWDEEDQITFTQSEVKNQERNPYGVIPFVRFTSKMPKDSYFVEGNFDLSNAQNAINVLLVQLNYLIKFQSFSVPVLLGYTGDNKEIISISPAKPIVMEESEQAQDFKFVTPDAKIAELADEIENKLRRISRKFGLDPSDYVVSADKASGASLQISNASLVNRLMADIPFYEDGEAELFDVFKKIWNYHADYLPSGHPYKGKKFNEKTILSVSINEPQLIQDTEEIRTNFEFEFENGLASSIDYLMRVYNLTDKEAIARYEEIQKNREEYPLNDITGGLERPAFESEYSSVQDEANDMEKLKEENEQETGNTSESR